jgi:predicted  nucleic acid-binding Zn-ribbon protein
MIAGIFSETRKQRRQSGHGCARCQAQPHREEVQREFERLQQENEELRRKVTHLDKQISEQHKQISEREKLLIWSGNWRGAGKIPASLPNRLLPTS